MAVLTTKVDIINQDKVKTLIEILADSIEDLPPKLKAQVKECLNSDTFEIDAAYMFSNGYEMPVLCYTDKVEIKDVMSINKHLRKVSSLKSDGIIRHERAGNFKGIDSNGKIVVEW